MKKKEHTDYFDVEFKPKYILGWLGIIFLYNFMLEIT